MMSLLRHRPIFASQFFFSSPAERFQQLHVSNNNKQQLTHQESSNYLHPKRKQVGRIHDHHHQAIKLEETHNTKFDYDHQENNCGGGGGEEEDDNQESQEEYDEEEKASYTTSTTPHSLCSRGVSTDELLEEQAIPNKHTPTNESTRRDSPPPPRPPPNQITTTTTKDNHNNNNTSMRFEDGDPVTESSSAAQGRNSVLLQLISCGSNLAIAKAKNNVTTSNNYNTKQPVTVKVSNVAYKKTSKVTKNVDLHKGVLCKTAVKVAEEDNDDHMIRFMSENPRFGNFQSEEKEYFSGSIVESKSHENRVENEPAGLKRSNSYNEERSSKPVLEEEGEAVKEDIKERAMKGKCMPRKKSSSSSKQTKKLTD